MFDRSIPALKLMEDYRSLVRADPWTQRQVGPSRRTTELLASVAGASETRNDDELWPLYAIASVNWGGWSGALERQSSVVMNNCSHGGSTCPPIWWSINQASRAISFRVPLLRRADSRSSTK